MEAGLPANHANLDRWNSRLGFLDSVAFFPVACATVLVAASFFNSVDVTRVSSSTGAMVVGLDWQVGVKLVIAAAAAAMGGWGLIQSRLVRQTLRSIPGIVLVLLALVFLATSVFALPEVANVCRAVSLINVGYLLFIPTALVTLGLRGVFSACFVGITANLFVSWALYLFVPSMGVFEEELVGAMFVERMGGMGHPNSMGRIGVWAGLLSLAILRYRMPASRHPIWTGTLIVIIVISLATCLATFSRTAIVAGFAAAIFLLLDRIATRGGLAVALIGLTTVAAGVFAMELVSDGDGITQLIVGAGTKTGQVEELTSATGRTAIWTETVRLISQRPLTGYGLNSAPILLEDFSNHPHNLLLHVTLSGGLLAGALVFILLIWNLVVGLTSTEPLIRAVSIYVLISGVFEDSCLDTFATSLTVMWITVMLYPAIAANLSADHETDQDMVARATQAV